MQNSDTPQSLNGPWMGRYNYVSRARPPVAFNAMLVDDDGDLSGETLEPNSFADLEMDSLIAGIIGVRVGPMVRFTKSYSDFDAARVEYSGVINAQFTRIDGTWSFAGGLVGRGTFVLIRDAVPVEQGLRRSKRAHAWLPAIWEDPGDEPERDT